MRMPLLDPRLKTVFDLFPACDVGADIGADHGRLSCNLLAQNKVRHMQVTDISVPSLDKARLLMAKHGLMGRTDFCVGDGLKALTEPAQAIAICGMGGELIRRILVNGFDMLSGAVLVICPQTDIPLVRRTIMEIGYHFTHEEAVLSSGRYYVVIKAEPGAVNYTEQEIYLGPLLMKRKSEETRKYYGWRFDVESCVKGQDENYLKWLKEVM